MRHHAPTAFIVLGIAAALSAAALAGCSGLTPSGTGPNIGGGMTGNGAPGTNQDGGSAGGDYASAGERIYLTGVGTDGREISHTAPRVSLGALMMGGGGCGSCHGTNGRGGTIRMMMGNAIDAPDITYDALIKAGFTDATVRKAITDGLDESGKPLDAEMPRWQMSETDLSATIAYLKELGTR